MSSPSPSLVVPTSIQDYLSQCQQRVDAALNHWVPADSAAPVTIHKAMRYSLFAGGKRIRPALCMTAAEVIDRDVRGAENPACALEMIHTYSLIHDDLPAMDNDDFRRGIPTNHKVFGEAMAILAGDALNTLAFQILAQMPQTPASTRVSLIEELAIASGSAGGMIAGQVHDLEGERQTPTPELLHRIHRAKTGALLRASVRMGAIYAGAVEEELEALTTYGEHMGLAFQIIDDILDVEASSEILGKTAGKDQEQQKITFPAVYGLETSRRMAESEREAASEALEPLGERARWLRALADVVVQRKS